MLLELKHQHFILEFWSNFCPTLLYLSLNNLCILSLPISSWHSQPTQRQSVLRSTQHEMHVSTRRRQGRQFIWTGRRGSDRCMRQDQRESLPLVTRPFIFICNPAGRQHTDSVVRTQTLRHHMAPFFVVVVVVLSLMYSHRSDRETNGLPVFSASYRFTLKEAQIGSFNVHTNPEWSHQDMDSEPKKNRRWGFYFPVWWEEKKTLLALTKPGKEII